MRDQSYTASAGLPQTKKLLTQHPHLKKGWLRGRDLNSRPSGYEPDELPGCSTPRVQNSFDVDTAQTEKTSLDLKVTRKRQSVCVRRPCAFVDTWRKDPLPNGKAAKFLSAPPVGPIRVLSGTGTRKSCARMSDLVGTRNISKWSK